MTAQPVSPAAIVTPASGDAGGVVQPADPRARAFAAACDAATGASGATAPAAPRRAQDARASAQGAGPQAAQPGQPGQDRTGDVAGATDGTGAAPPQPQAPEIAQTPRAADLPRSSLDRMLQRAAGDGAQGSGTGTAPARPVVAGAAHTPLPQSGKTAARGTATAPEQEPQAGPQSGPKTGPQTAAAKPAATPMVKLAQDSVTSAAPHDDGTRTDARTQPGKPRHHHKTAQHPDAPATPVPLLMPGLSQPPHPAPQAGRLRPAPGAAAIAQGVPHGSPGPAHALPGGGVDASAVAPADAAQATPESQAQLLQSATALAGAGGGAAKVTLHPATLGTVVVQVNVTPQGVTHVQMTASTEGGYRTLAATAGHLAQQLSHSGLNVGSVQALAASGGTATGAGGPPQPGTAQHGPQSGAAGGGMAGGFAGSRQQAGGGQGQHQPQPQPLDLTQTSAPTAAGPRPRSGPDDTVKAYA